MSGKEEPVIELSDTAIGVILGVGIVIIIALIYLWFRYVKPKGLKDVGPGIGTLLYFLFLGLILCWVLYMDTAKNNALPPVLPPGVTKHRNVLGVGLAGLLLYFCIILVFYGGVDGAMAMALALSSI